MKKNFIALGLICAAAFTLTNCTKELENPSKSDSPFEITATTGTKTTNNGLNTVWASGDILQVFHAATGTTEYGTKDLFDFVSDNSFKAEAELKNPLESGNYDWYAVYNGLAKTNPLFTETTDPTAISVYIGHTSSLTQTRNDNKEHLCGSKCPLFGITSNLSSSSDVNIPMKNLASVVEIAVTNKNEEDLTVSSVSITSPEAIVGKFVVDITKSPVEYTPDASALKTESLTVTSGTPIKKDGTASFFIPIRPHTLAAGQILSITVNGFKKEKTLTSDIVFQEGTIYSVNFNYDYVSAGTDCSFDWTTASYESSSGDKVVWNNEAITMTLSKNLSSTNANNYLGGGGNTHTRVYKDQILTFTPKAGKKIVSIKITATSASYANTFANGTWTNAAATASSTIVDVIPTDESQDVSVLFGAATRATGIVITMTD